MKRATITRDMPPPALVIEIVSPALQIVLVIIAINALSTLLEALLNTGLLTLKNVRLPSVSGLMGFMKT